MMPTANPSGRALLWSLPHVNGKPVLTRLLYCITRKQPETKRCMPLSSIVVKTALPHKRNCLRCQQIDCICLC